jgi:hypothetical protein
MMAKGKRLHECLSPIRGRDNVDFPYHWDSGKATEGRYIGGVLDKSAPTEDRMMVFNCIIGGENDNALLQNNPDIGTFTGADNEFSQNNRDSRKIHGGPINRR